MAAPRENIPAPREIAEPPQQATPKLRDIQMPVIAVNPSCIRLSDRARNYEVKSIHLTMLPQFNGLTAEDALSFIREFYSTVQTFPLQGLSEDELRLRCFPFCMKGEARSWLLTLEENSLDTWEKVYSSFMMKFYSPQRTMDLRGKIANFAQRESESFHEAWERFKLLLNQCPHHQYPLSLLVQFFYDGLTLNGQTLVDTAAGGYYGDKTAEEVKEICEMLSMNSRQKAVRGKRASVYELHTPSDLQAQVSDLTKMVEKLVTQSSSKFTPETCDYCGMYGHPTNACTTMESTSGQHEEANYMGAYGQQRPKFDPFSNHYNPGWRHHPNFAWKEQAPQRPLGPPGFQNQNQQQRTPFQQQRPQFQQQQQFQQ